MLRQVLLMPVTVPLIVILAVGLVLAFALASVAQSYW